MQNCIVGPITVNFLTYMYQVSHVMWGNWLNMRLLNTAQNMTSCSFSVIDTQYIKLRFNLKLPPAKKIYPTIFHCRWKEVNMVNKVLVKSDLPSIIYGISLNMYLDIILCFMQPKDMFPSCLCTSKWNLLNLLSTTDCNFEVQVSQNIYPDYFMCSINYNIWLHIPSGLDFFRKNEMIKTYENICNSLSGFNHTSKI